MTETILQTRIRERLDELGITPRAASLRAGLGPDAIRTILDGRSKSPRGERLQALARALECDIRYLLGATKSPGKAVMPTALPHSLPLKYRLAAGAWRAEDEEQIYPGHEQGYFAAIATAAFDQHPQWLEVVLGDWFGALIPDSYFVQVQDAVSLKYVPQQNDVVVVVRTRANGTFKERSLRKVVIAGDQISLITMPAAVHNTSVAIYPSGDEADETVEIVGRVVWAHRPFFGGAEPFKHLVFNAEYFPTIPIDAE